MLSTLPGSGILAAPGLLTRRGPGLISIKERLQALLLIKRSWIIEECHHQARWAHALNLYRELFDELPEGLDGRWSQWDIENELYARINREKFPLCYTHLNDCNSSGESPLDYQMVYQGYGVPSEILSVPQLHAAAQPLVAIMTISTGGANLVEYDYSVEQMFMAAVDWWDQLPHDRLENVSPDFIWPQSYEGVQLMVQRLWNLEHEEPPLNGLATMLRCIQKETGNEFLDTPEYFAYEYENFYGYFDWDAESIESLALIWAEVREQVAQMERYIDWINLDPGDERQIQVLNLLLRLGCEVDQELNAPPREPRTLVEIFSQEEE